MLLCRISCELAGCIHQPIVGSGQTDLSHLYFSRLSLAMPAKLNFFKTPTSVRLVQVGPCPLPLEYQAATSHTGRQPCRVKSLYMKRFWVRPCTRCSLLTSSPALCFSFSYLYSAVGVSFDIKKARGKPYIKKQYTEHNIL
jgi:hypothetical protein